MGNPIQRPLRLGTRGSPLALAQASMTREALARAHHIDADQIEVVVIQTTGDRVQDRPLAEIGGKALWTRELDGALLDGRIDFAVHSMKDVETIVAEGVALVAMLPRADARDRLIGAGSLDDLPQGARVGTSSPRRHAQLLNRRPDLVVESLRGNVETRLRRIAEGRFAATLLAAAGLDRLSIDAGAALEMDDWLPAVSQGAIGIACRTVDESLRHWLAAVDHPVTHRTVAAERALLAHLGGSCHTAIAAHASESSGQILLRAELLSPDGRDCVRYSASAEPGDWERLAQEAARHLLDNASDAIRSSLV